MVKTALAGNYGVLFIGNDYCYLGCFGRRWWIMIEWILDEIRKKKDKYADLANSSNFDGWAQEEAEYLAKEEVCDELIEIVQKVVKDGGWIPVTERLPESENKYGWVSCIVTVNRSHYPTSSYDICDSPYDETIVMHANYHVPQKIWHLECDEQLNALMDIEDAPLNGDYVVAWMELPAPYQKGE